MNTLEVLNDSQQRHPLIRKQKKTRVRLKRPLRLAVVLLNLHLLDFRLRQSNEMITQEVPPVSWVWNGQAVANR